MMTRVEEKKKSIQVKKQRGRPVTGTAKSDAERARLYRLRKKEQGERAGKATSESKTIAELQRDLATMTDIASKLIEEKQSRKKLERSVFVSLCQAHLKIQMKHSFL